MHVNEQCQSDAQNSLKFKNNKQEKKGKLEIRFLQPWFVCTCIFKQTSMCNYISAWFVDIYPYVNDYG